MNFLNRNFVSGTKGSSSRLKPRSKEEQYYINGVDIGNLESASQYDETEDDVRNQLDEIMSQNTSIKQTYTSQELIYFKEEVSQYSELEMLISKIKKQLKPLQEQLKKLNSEKKNINKIITNFMYTHDVEAINLTRPKKEDDQDDQDVEDPGALKCQLTNKIMPVNKEYIKESLINFFKLEIHKKYDDRRFHDMDPYLQGSIVFDYIYKNNRERIEIPTIKKVKFIDNDIDIKKQVQYVEQL